MPTLRIRQSAVVPAPAPVVYGLISDYRHGPPSILPPEYFEDLAVEEGGQGGQRAAEATRNAPMRANPEEP